MRCPQPRAHGDGPPVRALAPHLSVAPAAPGAVASGPHPLSLQAHATVSFIPRAKDTDVHLPSSLPSQHPQSRRRRQRDMAALSTQKEQWARGEGGGLCRAA